MFKVVVGVLALLLVLALIPVAVIAFSAPSSPPELGTESERMKLPPMGRVGYGGTDYGLIR